MGHPDLEKHEFWRDVVRRQQKSGQTVRGYCRDNNLSEPSFYSWKRKLAGEEQASSEAAKNSRRHERKDAMESSASNAPAFIPLRLSATNQDVVEIVHPRGHVVRVPVCFQREMLREIIELLDKPKGA